MSTLSGHPRPIKTLKDCSTIDFHDAWDVAQDAPRPLRTSMAIEDNKSDPGHHPA
jgi:hypothetical protein